VGENEQPSQPDTGNLPEVPPAGVDPETFRQYQEFQRFQEFQRYTQAKAPSGAPWTAEGGNLEPAAPRPDVHEQLAGVHARLQKIQDSQAKIEKVTNPPLWRKILRSTPFRWVIGILVLILLAAVGVPLLIQHYFGNHNQVSGNGANPLPKNQSGALTTGPHQAVFDVYHFIAERDAKDGCFIFSASAANAFARAFNTGSCSAAFAAIYPQVADAPSYGNPDLTELPSPQGPRMTISSCDFSVTGGPRLGTFTVTQQDQGWEITGYQAQQPCPADSTTPPTTGPTEPAPTTSQGPASEAPIPTGGFSGIPVS
jgi:hypothetical protein